MPGVRREAVQHVDPGPDHDVLAEDLHQLLAVGELPPQRSLDHVAHEHDIHLRPPQVVAQVMHDAASLAHSRGTQDDAGLAALVERCGLPCGRGDPQAGQIAGKLPARGQFPGFAVEHFRVPDQRLGRTRGHGTVEDDREVARQPALAHGLREVIQDQLGATDREGRYQHPLIIACRALENALEGLDGVFLRRALAAAIGGLEKHDVGLGGGLGIPEDRHAPGPEVARKDDHLRPAAILHGQRDARRAHDVPRLMESQRETGRDLPLRAIAQCTHALMHVPDVLGRIDRLQQLLAGALSRPVQLRHPLDVQPRQVLEQDRRQRQGCGGGDDGAPIAARIQQRHAARVVYVRVRQHGRIEAARVDRAEFAAASPRVAAALEHAEVHQHLGSRRLEQVTRARDFPRRAAEADPDHLRRP